ncbi:MAG: FAD-dependent oxidoreductase [Pirellulaceae bacterium]|nr:FAD-dependent oxidoreductase [Planctomycetales bacterium]
MTKTLNSRRTSLVFAATLAAITFGASPSFADPSTADVIVYGATPGGVCAAIGAAREGVSVTLLEPTNHVGGMNTGGLSHSDSNQCARSTVMGLFDEWHTRIANDYRSRGIELPYDVRVKDQAIWTYEPHVAARVTKQMLDEAGVQVLTGRYLLSAKKDGPRITEIITSNGTFTANVFVDATYEGDLMAAADVSWTIGREGREEFGESYAGKQYPKKKMDISGFGVRGQPLPLITTIDDNHRDNNHGNSNTSEADGEVAGDRNVMVYSFRLCLTEDPENRVPLPEPDRYDPARFEVVRRYVQAGGRVGFDLYALPGNKWDGNNSIGGQFSLGLVGGGNDWCEADETGRAAIWEAHKQYTLELYHFLTTDSAVPDETRQKYSRLGLCKDEFADYGHFSPALYVREGRRMRGKYVLSQNDILEEPVKDDPIVVSSFPIDSHDCQRIALKDGGVINEGTIFPVRREDVKQGYAYHVPYRSIVPQPTECSNLLVPVALSCTHVGIASIRVEPTWMVLGQSAGIAAALTCKEQPQRSVQELSYSRLRDRLLGQGQVLELPR